MMSKAKLCCLLADCEESLAGAIQAARPAQSCRLGMVLGGDMAPFSLGPSSAPCLSQARMASCAARPMTARRAPSQPRPATWQVAWTLRCRLAR